MVGHSYNLRYSEGGDRRIVVQDEHRQKHETLSEKQTKNQKNCLHGSDGRAHS
jgi:hypothetical protein